MLGSRNRGKGPKNGKTPGRAGDRETDKRTRASLAGSAGGGRGGASPGRPGRGSPLWEANLLGTTVWEVPGWKSARHDLKILA